MVLAVDVPCYAATVCSTVFDRWHPARTNQDIVGLVRCPTVTGVPRQQMLKTSIGDDHSTENHKRDQAVTIFGSFIKAESLPYVTGVFIC